MHIPDGFIDPKFAGALGAAAFGFILFALNKLKSALTEPAAAFSLAGLSTNVRTISENAKRTLSRFGQEYIIKMGLVASLVFAAQMFNFPISHGTSGHLIGGVLAVVLLGPWGGFLTLCAVVIVQAIFYADGGLITLGTNIINMGFIAGFLSFYIYKYLKTLLRPLISIGAAAWCSVLLAALFCSIELGISGTYAFSKIMASMLSVHAVIGIVEAFLTMVLVKLSESLLGWQTA